MLYHCPSLVVSITKSLTEKWPTGDPDTRPQAITSPRVPGGDPMARSRLPTAKATPSSQVRGARTQLTFSRGTFLPQLSQVKGNLGQIAWCALKRSSQKRQRWCKGHADAGTRPGARSHCTWCHHPQLQGPRGPQDPQPQRWRWTLVGPHLVVSEQHDKDKPLTVT